MKKVNDKQTEKKVPFQWEVTIDLKHGVYLKRVQRYRKPFERGIWIEVAPKKHPDAQRLVRMNQQIGLEVLIDENNVYRALVLKD